MRAIIALLLCLWAHAAFAQETKNRVALVIGNSAYHRATLANAVNDARLIAERLKAGGFEVLHFYDVNQRDMKRAIQTFAAKLRERGSSAEAFIYYSGHGVQVKGENYLIPVDEHIESEGDVDIDAVSLSSVMSMLENSQTRLSVVVLDACRDNPFGYSRGGTRGLARVDAPAGSLIAFSTSPGKAAPDGPAGGNSYYTAALAQTISEPGLTIEEVFKKVRVAVRERTGGEQTPWETTSLTGDFYPAGASVQVSETKPIILPDQVSSAPRTVPPKPQTNYYYVWDTRPPDNWLSLRSEAGPNNGRRIAELPNGTLLEILERRADDWWRVRAVERGLEGWVLTRQGSRVWVYCCKSR